MARKKPEIAELPTRLLVVELGSGKRWKRIGAIAAVGAVVLGVGIYVLATTLDASQAEERAANFAALGRCLLGEALTEGQTASSRVLNVQLRVVGTPMERRAKPTEVGWPANCAPFASALAEHAGSGEGAALGEAAHALAKVIKEDIQAITDFRPQAEAVWKAAGALKLEMSLPTKDGLQAPVPLPPLFSQATLKELPPFLSGSFSLSTVHEEPSVANGKLHFLVDQKDASQAPVVCTAKAGDPTVQCVKVSAAAAALSPGLSLVGTTSAGARPFIFAGDRGQLGVFPPDGGDKLATSVAIGASARDDGSLTLLTSRDGKRDLTLSYFPAVGRKVDRPFSGDIDAASDAGLFWDFAAFRAQKRGESDSHLVVRKLASAAGEPDRAQDVGVIGAPPQDRTSKEPYVTACRSDEATAVRVRGATSDSVAIFAGGRWSTPSETGTLGGALTCRGVEAITTTVTPAMEGDKNYATITHSRCNSSGCTPTKVSLKQMLAGLSEIVPNDARGVVAADVGGKLMIAWNAGYVGGVRMRLGAPDRIKDASDIVISDARDDEKRLSALVEMRALSAGDHALLFLSTTAGVQVLRVEASGDVTPMISAQ